jgi:hypothetical protein
MPLKDKEKRNEYRRNYYEKNKDKEKEYSINYYRNNYGKNKEKRREYQRNYNEKNKEKRKEYISKYRQTELGIKTRIRTRWKQLGIICDYDTIYDIYINTTCCDYCKKEFKNSKERHLDHCHESGAVRGILCRKCNLKDVLNEKIIKI